MKKISFSAVSFLLSVLICVSLTSCGGDDSFKDLGLGDITNITMNGTTYAKSEQRSVYEIYSDAVNKSNSFGCMYQKQKNAVSMSFELMGQSVNTLSNIQSDVKIKNALKDDMMIELKRSVTTVSMGQTSSSVTEIFADKDYVYTKQDGEYNYSKINRKSSDADTINELLNDEKNWKITPLGQSAFDGAKADERADGSVAISASPTKESLDEFMSGTFDQLFSNLSSLGATVENCEFNNTSLEFTIDKNGYFSLSKIDTDISFDLFISGFSVTVNAHMNSEIVFVDPGTAFDIEMPGDIYYEGSEPEESFYEEYTEDDFLPL